MNPTVLLLILIGLGFGAGAWCLVAGLNPVDTTPGGHPEGQDRVVYRPGRERRARRRARLSRRELGRGSLAILATAGVWLLSGWPVAGLLTGTLLVVLPWLFGAAKITQARLDRIDALAAWCRRLRDLMGTGQVVLLQAIRESANTAPAHIATDVTTLAARLRTGEVSAALREFADDIDDSLGDQIAAALIIAYEQGAGVSRVLDSLAKSVDTEVAARLDIEAQRAGPRKTARILVWIYLGLLALLGLNSSYLRPYDTALGQLVMLLLSVTVVAALVWLRRLSLAGDPPRFLVADRPDLEPPAPQPGTPTDTAWEVAR
jgi:Flp pilus assembly protein TadB